jgi:hypothetical protein
LHPLSARIVRARRVNGDAFHQRQIDHQAGIANGETGDVVAGAAHGNEKLLLASAIHRRDHIVATGAAGDQRGPPVDRRVEHGARGVVPLVAWKDQLTSKAGFQLVNGGRSNHCGPPFFGFFSRRSSHGV